MLTRQRVGNVDSPHIMADSSSESNSESPVVKKSKNAGVAKYKSKFKSLLHCNVCNHTLLCAHQREADFKHYVASDGNTALAKE